MYVSMYIMAVTPEHIYVCTYVYIYTHTYTPAYTHVYALHVQVYTNTEFNTVIDIYHISIISTSLMTCALK